MGDKSLGHHAPLSWRQHPLRQDAAPTRVPTTRCSSTHLVVPAGGAAVKHGLEHLAQLGLQPDGGGGQRDSSVGVRRGEVRYCPARHPSPLPQPFPPPNPPLLPLVSPEPASRRCSALPTWRSEQTAAATLSPVPPSWAAARSRTATVMACRSRWAPGFCMPGEGCSATCKGCGGTCAKPRVWGVERRAQPPEGGARTNLHRLRRWVCGRAGRCLGCAAGGISVAA